MAAYAVTVTLDVPKAVLVANYPRLGMIRGVANITNYNTVQAEVTTITGKFKGAARVVCLGVADGAVKELVRWDDTAKAFKCYVPTTGAEVANDVAVGNVAFTAFGVM